MSVKSNELVLSQVRDSSVGESEVLEITDHRQMLYLSTSHMQLNDARSRDKSGGVGCGLGGLGLRPNCKLRRARNHCQCMGQMVFSSLGTPPSSDPTSLMTQYLAH